MSNGSDFRKKHPGPSIWEQAGRDKPPKKHKLNGVLDGEDEEERKKKERFEKLKNIMGKK